MKKNIKSVYSEESVGIKNITHQQIFLVKRHGEKGISILMFFRAQGRFTQQWLDEK